MNLYILGAGGHGKVAADVANLLKLYKKIFFLDDNKKIGEKVLDFIIADKIDIDFIKSKNNKNTKFFVAIGDSEKRKEITAKLLGNKINITTLIHPQTSISKYTKIGVGSLICSGAIIGPDSILGKGTILNHSSTVDHDCVIGEFSHICPNCSIAGGVRVGGLSFLGIGSSVIQGIEIGDNCFIGAGAVVTQNIPSSKKAIGIPAKVIN